MLAKVLETLEKSRAADRRGPSRGQRHGPVFASEDEFLAALREAAATGETCDSTSR